MARLGLSLLGGFLLRADARARPLPARKSQALLAYLALRAGRAHARETLTGLLWADVGEKQARQSLRQTLVRLRRVLAGASPAALVVQGDTVTLNPSALDVDVARFERLIRQGTPGALETAVTLYEGPLLDGIQVTAPAFEEWLYSQRARLHELALDALRRVTHLHVKAGRVEAATQNAARLVAFDPLQEDAHRTLMQLYVRHGRRAAALRQYQACVAVLQKELGVEPEPETRRLYLAILQSAAPAASRASESDRRDAAPTIRLVLPAADTPLVGREAEIARLRQCMRSAWRGRGQMVLVTGEAGIGKSRLVEELAAAAQGARVLSGRAHETEQILPFRPWVDALRAAPALVRLASAEAGTPGRRSELARLFPELARGDAQPPTTPEGHLRVFESIDALIADVARTEPLLLVLEDLHWADEMTVRLLSFVVRRLGDRPVLLVGTARDEEMPDTPALGRLVTELLALPNVEQITLGGLSAPATAALVRALARAGSHDARLAEITDKIWTLSEGNPFVIVETMRTLREGRLPDATGVELPQRVRAMIAARLDRLSPRAQELARIASVFTREFEFSVLQRASGLNRRETAEGVEELVRRRILDAVGERFDFTHARIRQSVYPALLTPRRQALHAAIGEAVEAVYAGRLDDWYDRLSYHFSRADEPAKAFTYLVHFADKAARGYALEEAVRVLRDALGYADRLSPEERGPRRLDVVYRLAHVLGLLGRPADALDVLTAQASLVAELREPALSGVYHVWLAHTRGNLGDSPGALQHAKRALEDAARGGDEITMGKANYTLAYHSHVIGRAREGIAHARQAVALLERSGERWWLGQALWALARNLIHVGDLSPAVDALDRMRRIGESLGDLRLQAYALGTTGRAYAHMGEFDAAITACRSGVELAADPVAQAHALGWLGAAHWDNADPAQAIPLLEDAIGRLQHLSGAGGYRRWDGWFASMLSEAYLAKGETDRARDCASGALTAATAGGLPVAIGYAECAVGRVALADGKLDEAEAALRRALERFVAVDARYEVARAGAAVAELLAARGDLRAAAAGLKTTRAIFTDMRAPRRVQQTVRLAGALGLELD